MDGLGSLVGTAIVIGGYLVLGKWYDTSYADKNYISPLGCVLVPIVYGAGVALILWLAWSAAIAVSAK